MDSRKKGATIATLSLLLISLLSAQFVVSDTILEYKDEYTILGGNKLALSMENMGYVVTAQVSVAYTYTCEPANEQFVAHQTVTSEQPGQFYVYFDLLAPTTPGSCSSTPTAVVVSVTIISAEPYEEPGPNVAPTIESVTATPESGTAPLSVLFQVDADDSDGTIAKWEWKYGDGSTQTGTGYPPAAIHIFQEASTYLATIKVWDDGNLTASHIIKINAFDPKEPLAGVFDITGETTMDVALAFSAAGLAPDESIVSTYRWAFGDGTTATGKEVAHTYDAGGDYEVTLTVTYTDTTFETQTQTITITENQMPIVSLQVSGTQKTGHVLAFDGSGSYDPEGEAITFLWDFGDGQTATESTVEHAYSSTGDYVVTLTVSDGEVSAQSSTTLTMALNLPPTAHAAVSRKSSDCMTVVASAEGSQDPDGDILSYHWDFGDGTTGTGIVAEHIYETSGTYSVTLTVSDGALESVSSAEILVETKGSMEFIPYLIPILAILVAIAVIYHYKKGHKRPFDDLDLTSKE